jgi:small-conductance mechanosensitive channel
MEAWFSPQLLSLLRELQQPGAWIGLVLGFAAAPIAWGIPRLIAGRVPHPGTLWLGGRIVDGALFPAIWLALVALAEHVCRRLGLPVAVFKLAIPVLTSLLGIRFTVRIFRAAFPNSTIVRAVERWVSWLAWITVVLWITGVLPSFLDALDDIRWKSHTGTMSLLTVLEGMAAAALALVITLWISSVIEQRMLRGAVGQRLSWRKAASNVLRTVLVVVGLLMTLSAVGIDLTALSVLGGAIGVGLGFGLQKLASNYVSGFVVLAEGALRIGDTVKVDGFEGRITDIKTRYTVLRALNGRESIIPNEMLIIQRVESATLADPRVLLSTVVQVAYGTALDGLMTQIVEVVSKVQRVLPDPEPSVALSQFGADGLELTISFWIADPENGTGGVRSDVNLALLRLFDREDVEIPYPQRVLRMLEGGPSNGEGEALAVRPSAGSAPAAPPPIEPPPIEPPPG